MKKICLLAFITASLLLTSCQRSRCCDDVVCETYVHPYGLAVSEGEWCRQGASGEVISTRKNGVTEKSTYSNGLLEGRVTYTFPYRDAIEKVEVYSRDKLKKETRYFLSGAVREDIEYPSANERVVKTFYDQGSAKSEERYVGERLNHATYYNLKGGVESRVDDFNGKATLRDIYGQLLSVDTIEDGHVAASTTYHLNGMPEAITPFCKGIIHGERKTFLPGGEPSTIEQWEDGSQHGTTVVFEEGERVVEIPYVRGAKNGVERRYCDDDVVESICWAGNLKHGANVRYVEGQVITDYFYNGATVSKAVYEKRCGLLKKDQ